MNFSDLKFQPHPVAAGGVQAKYFFPNGYGISVVRFKYSYGYEAGAHYESAVLKGTEEN